LKRSTRSQQKKGKSYKRKKAEKALKQLASGNLLKSTQAGKKLKRLFNGLRAVWKKEERKE